MAKPKEWSDATVGELTHQIIGGGTPSRKVAEYFGGDIPWATVKDMSGDAFFKSDTIEHITKEAVLESASNLIDAESIIIATRMGIGRGFINTKPMAINQDLKALMIDKERVDAYFFLYWYIHSGSLFAAKGGGSTVQGITLDDLRAFQILLPTKHEQQKIAEILSSVDTAIENNESLVNKLTDLKKALMQELFTKGIGHKEFKESPLGRIPKDWEVVECRCIISEMKSGLSRKLASKDIGLPMMTSGNIQKGLLDSSELKYWYEKDPQGANTQDYLLENGDMFGTCQ
jgi:type I restriction enzyme, S subunit